MPRRMLACLAVAMTDQLSACRSAPIASRSSAGSSHDAGSSTSAVPNLAEYLTSGPRGWTSQASPPAVTLGTCADGVASPRPLKNVIGSWRQDPRPPSPGMTAIPSVDVCLCAFSTSTEAQSVRAPSPNRNAPAESPKRCRLGGHPPLPPSGTGSGRPGCYPSALSNSRCSRSCHHDRRTGRSPRLPRNRTVQFDPTGATRWSVRAQRTMTIPSRSTS